MLTSFVVVANHRWLGYFGLAQLKAAFTRLEQVGSSLLFEAVTKVENSA